MFFTNNCDGVRQNVATMFFNSITTTQIMNTKKSSNIYRTVILLW